MLASLLNRVGIKLTLTDRAAVPPRWGRKPGGDYKAQESKKPGDGPPDLDQMWRDFNARLNRMFGAKNSGDAGGPGGYRPDSKGAGVTAGVIAIIVALIWLASGDRKSVV